MQSQSLPGCSLEEELKNGKADTKDLLSVLQQDDKNKTFFLDIINNDIKTAYDHKNGATGYDVKDDNHVIIVGAGISGLSAAFELEKVGYRTTILEVRNRVGGRIKTIYFEEGLHGEAGAMRIPETHAITLEYMKLFNIELIPFVCFNPKTYYHIHGKKIRAEDWLNDNKRLSNELFPGWDSHLNKLPSKDREEVVGIVDYYKRTFHQVVLDLCRLLKKFPDDGWERWDHKWSKLTIVNFLRSDIYQEPDWIKYRPWPAAAFEGFIATTEALPKYSAVEFFRYALGGWRANILNAPKYGMCTLPESFLKHRVVNDKNICLKKQIHYGMKVEAVKEKCDGKVKVTAKSREGNKHYFYGNAVILTLPLPILRDIDIDVGSFDINYEKAIANVSYCPLTKIFLQCRTRFWEKEVGIGGATRTSLPIYELHYLPNNGKGQRGILMAYSWDQNALIMGSQGKEKAIESAIHQIAKIHPEIYDQFEVGYVKSWSHDSASQGGKPWYLPYQYNEVINTLMTPAHPIYLAGDAVSYSHGWMQGALESGINAAYKVYCHDVQRSKKLKIPDTTNTSSSACIIL